MPSPLRLLLLLTSPLWGPLALLWALARICQDGLLFVVEGYLDRPIEPSLPLRFLLFPLSPLLFPLLIAGETTLSFLLFLGGLPFRIFGKTNVPWPARAAFGLPVALLAPLWGPLVAAIWVLRRLVYDLGVVGLSDRISGEATATRGRSRFETFVALRTMRGRKATAGVSVVTGLTIVGVTLGVWTLVVVLSVMAGFEVDLQDKILGTNGHVVVLSYNERIEDWEPVAKRIQSMEGVTGVTPFVYSEYMLRSSHTVMGAIFKGIHPPSVAKVTDLAQNLTLGPDGHIESDAAAQKVLDSLESMAPPQTGLIDPKDRSAAEDRAPLPGLLVGKEMARTLRVSVGDVVHAHSPNSEPGPLGSMQARVLPFRVAGIFHSGMYEYDSKFTYATLDQARRFLRMGDAVTGLELRVADIYEAPRIAELLKEELKWPFWTLDWQEMNETLYAALRLEKVVMGIILTFIVAVASMNIISTLTLVIIEKRREIAILKAMGAGRRDLMKLFVVDGLLVGFIGTVLGLGLGLATCAVLARWQPIKLESDVYYVDTLPVDVSTTLVVSVALIAVGISFLATLFPAWQGGSLDPVEGLRDG